MQHANVSIFIPHAGCPHMCSFCNQRTISGERNIPKGDDVRKICEQALNEVKSPQDSEIAFFGGSFTAISRDYMLELLNAADEFVGEGKFKGIRISTRPDYIDEEILMILKNHGVTAIELGAQSMIDEVLAANERGHTAKDVEAAAKLIKVFDCFELGLQMMTGLYKSSVQKDFETWQALAKLNPGTMRIYPTVILENTKLGRLYKSGEYKPYPFDDAVKLCAKLLCLSQKKGIRIIKLGLHASSDVEDEILGGYYHPAFRELCESMIFREKMEKHILGKSAVFAVAPKNISKAVGQKKSNIEYFKSKGIDIKIIPDKGLQNDENYLVKLIEI